MTLRIKHTLQEPKLIGSISTNILAIQNQVKFTSTSKHELITIARRWKPSLVFDLTLNHNEREF